MSRFSRRRFLRDAAAVASASYVAPCAALGDPGGMLPSGGRNSQAIEDALALLNGTGPEYGGRLANHGPMAAEALVVLGRPGAVVPWVERYRTRLDGRLQGTRKIVDEDWPAALGDGSRVGDWTSYFQARVRETPWREVLDQWTGRLAPGAIAAAFHGLIRTAHAARSLAAEETPARRRELAAGLAYWAATYETLPESHAARPARRSPGQALRDVAALPSEKRIGFGNITHRLEPLRGFPPFAGVADLVATSGDPSSFVSDLTETFAHVYLASVPSGNLITYVHTVTGPSAARLLLPHVAPAARSALMRYVWQGAAALYASTGGRLVETAGPSPAPADRDQLIDGAIATGDEHAIKFVEACLREHALAPKPIYLRAAQDAIARFGGS